MKKFSKLISMILAFAMILCATSVVAFAEEPTLLLDTAEFSGYVNDECWVWAELSDHSPLTAEIIWESSDESVATISSTGAYNIASIIRIVGAGTCTVTAAYKGQTVTIAITGNSYDALAFNAENPIVDDGSGCMAQFTAPADGYYSFGFSATDCQVYGNVYGNEFSLSPDGEAAYAVVALSEGESVLVSCTAWLWDTELTEANYSIMVTEAPEATGYQLSETAIKLNFLTPDYCENGWVYVSPVPETAAPPSDLTWKLGDETLAELYSEGAECYILPQKAGTTTLSAYTADGELIGTVTVTINDISKYMKDINWGVLYDFDPEDELNMFVFTAAKDDTYTVESFLLDDEEADPQVSVYIKDGDDWVFVDNLDDQYDPEYSLLFKGEFEMAAGDTYMFALGNWTDDTAYSFSVKGTAASDPGYKPEKVAAKDATCAEQGNIEHYKCSVTGLLFADAEGTRMAENVFIEKLPHKLEKVAATDKTVAHEKCSVCGALVVDGKEVDSIDNPKTGDNAMLLPMVALSVLSITGLAVAVVGKKNAI